MLGRSPHVLRRSRPSAFLHAHNGLRMVSSKVHRLPSNPGDEPQDFRPPRFYTISRALSWILIPATVAYAVFVYDFGDHEHVFQPARRWAERQKAVFFALSPDEKEIVDGEQPTNTQK